MLPLTSAAPTTAERIRSACTRAGGALLAIENEDARKEPVATPVHHLLHDGSFAVAVPADRDGGAARVDGSQALLELTDYAPLPLRQPVRSLVWVRGHLQQVPPSAVAKMLDLIATECPDPALLQVDTPRSMPSDGAEPRYTLLRDRVPGTVYRRGEVCGMAKQRQKLLKGRRPRLFAEITGSGVTQITNRPVVLPPCPVRRCGRCGQWCEMRSYAGGPCEDCWSELARLACWNGRQLNLFKHSCRRRRAG